MGGFEFGFCNTGLAPGFILAPKAAISGFQRLLIIAD
jgi:hypothetical protein